VLRQIAERYNGIHVKTPNSNELDSIICEPR
jgi:hypothetical protein